MTVHSPRGRRLTIERVISKAREEGRTVLTEHESKNLIKEYGISIPRERQVYTEEEAISAAEEIGYPVVLKLLSPQATHKSDLGLVRLGIKNEDDLIRNYREVIGIAERENLSISGILVQEMIPQGIELIIGGIKDQHFGPTVMFGLGGIFVEVLEDVSFRVAPIDESEAKKMIREIKGYKIIRGIRGKKGANEERIAQAISSISRLMYDWEREIKEIDINPLIAYDDNAVAVDARIILEG